jgi:hypothetical protein
MVGRIDRLTDLKEYLLVAVFFLQSRQHQVTYSYLEGPPE